MKKAQRKAQTDKQVERSVALIERVFMTWHEIAFYNKYFPKEIGLQRDRVRKVLLKLNPKQS